MLVRAADSYSKSAIAELELAMKILQFLAVIALCAVAANAAPKAQVLRFHEVTREEYNQLLQLTNEEGQVSEARLLSSPLSGIKHLASMTGLSSSLFSDYSKRRKVYPLCVVAPDDDEDEKSFGEHQHDNGENGNDDTDGEEPTPVDRPTFCTLVVKGSSSDSNVIYLPKPKPKPKPKPNPNPNPNPNPSDPNHPSNPEHPQYPHYPHLPPYSGYPGYPPIYSWYPVFYPPYGHHGPHGPHGPQCPPGETCPPACDPATEECE
ncbi:hypothetical protein ACLKA7_000454 [Drosophila subpalustris]